MFRAGQKCYLRQRQDKDTEPFFWVIVFFDLGAGQTSSETRLRKHVGLFSDYNFYSFAVFLCSISLEYSFGVFFWSIFLKHFEVIFLSRDTVGFISAVLGIYELSDFMNLPMNFYNLLQRSLLFSSIFLLSEAW